VLKPGTPRSSRRHAAPAYRKLNSEMNQALKASESCSKPQAGAVRDRRHTAEIGKIAQADSVKYARPGERAQHQDN